MAVTGIYKITSPDGKIYIGQSTDIIARFRGHRSCKSAAKLQASYDKHGVENHKFEIVTECLKDDLYANESYYQELYNSTGDNGLNTVLENPNRKISQRKETSLRGANHPFFGRKYSEAEREIKRKEQPIKLRGAHQKAKIVMCTQTGIFYNCALDACDAYGYKKARLCNMLAGFDKNLTSLIYA